MLLLPGSALLFGDLNLLVLTPAHLQRSVNGYISIYTKNVVCRFVIWQSIVLIILPCPQREVIKAILQVSLPVIVSMTGKWSSQHCKQWEHCRSWQGIHTRILPCPEPWQSCYGQWYTKRQAVACHLSKWHQHDSAKSGLPADVCSARPEESHLPPSKIQTTYPAAIQNWCRAMRLTIFLERRKEILDELISNTETAR